MLDFPSLLRLRRRISLMWRQPLGTPRTGLKLDGSQLGTDAM